MDAIAPVRRAGAPPLWQLARLIPSCNKQAFSKHGEHGCLKPQPEQPGGNVNFFLTGFMYQCFAGLSEELLGLPIIWPRLSLTSFGRLQLQWP